MQLLTSGASPVPTGEQRVEARTTLVVPITDPLPEGAYTVTWRVVSIDDGHVTAGAFAFGVGTAPTGDPGPDGDGRLGTDRRSRSAPRPLSTPD